MSLRDLTQIKPENFRETTVPLKIDHIKEFFENKELFFIVDYKGSNIKGNMFLTYLSNLDLPNEINLKDAALEEKFELVKAYMETRNINHSDTLRVTVADLLLTFKKVDCTEFYLEPIFTPEEKSQFIEKHQELIAKWDTFISSCLVFLIKCFKDLNGLLKTEEVFEIINDPAYIGLNVVKLFDIPHFLEFYYSAPLTSNIYYFKPQFEEYMFKGQNLFSYFNTQENTFLHLLAGFFDGRIEVDKFVEYVTSDKL